jgi:hypothetical protein
LQSCLDVLRGEQELCTETCSASSGDGKQFVFVNVDDDSVIKQQEDPEPTASTAIKNDPVVSVMSVCIQCFTDCTSIDCCLSVHLSLSNIWTHDQVFNIGYEIGSGILYCL